MMDQVDFPSLTPVEKPSGLGVEHDTTVANSPVSFASIAARIAPNTKPLFEALKFPVRQNGSKDGKPAISFSAAEVFTGRRRHEHTLVAKFTTGRPTMDEIRHTFESHWKLAGRAAIGSWHDGSHVLVVLQSDDDVRRVLSSPLNMVKHSLFRIYRWSPTFNVRKESPTITTWLRLPGIPIDLYDPGFIEPMVAPFAKFIDVDDRTKALTNPSYARVCIELDVTKPIPADVWICLPDDRSYWQSIVVERKIKFCFKCRCHGHDLESCRRKLPARNLDNPVSKTPNGQIQEGSAQPKNQAQPDSETNKAKVSPKIGK